MGISRLLCTVLLKILTVLWSSWTLIRLHTPVAWLLNLISLTTLPSQPSRSMLRPQMITSHSTKTRSPGKVISLNSRTRIISPNNGSTSPTSTLSSGWELLVCQPSASSTHPLARPYQLKHTTCVSETTMMFLDGLELKSSFCRHRTRSEAKTTFLVSPLLWSAVSAWLLQWSSSPSSCLRRTL